MAVMAAAEKRLYLLDRHTLPYPMVSTLPHCILMHGSTLLIPVVPCRHQSLRSAIISLHRPLTHDDESNASVEVNNSNNY